MQPLPIPGQPVQSPHWSRSRHLSTPALKRYTELSRSLHIIREARRGAPIGQLSEIEQVHAKLVRQWVAQQASMTPHELQVVYDVESDQLHSLLLGQDLPAGLLGALHAPAENVSTPLPRVEPRQGPRI